MTSRYRGRVAWKNEHKATGHTEGGEVSGFTKKRTTRRRNTEREEDLRSDGSW